MRVLRAWAAPLEQQSGWGVVRQLFVPVAGGAEWERLGVGAAALAARVLDPDPDAPAPRGDAVHAATHGLTWLAYGLAEIAPTLFVVDDVHWADVPSVRWLAQLGRQVDELRLGVVCAVRTGEPPADPGGLAELLATAAGPPVRPRPLGPEAVGTIVGERLPTAAPSFAYACHAASAGNPFLLGALLDQLCAEGVEPTADVASRITTFGAGQVSRSVELQLSRLPAGSADLARAFAVLGRGATIRQAAALCRVPAPEAGRLADHLRASGLLAHADDGYTLAHPLVASALYRGMPEAHRSLLHRRAVAVLAADRAGPEDRGLHLLHTEPAGDPETVTTLGEAAERATARGAPESAVVFLRRALVEPPGDAGLAAELSCELGLCLAAHAQPDAGAVLFDAVARATSPEQCVRVALSGGRALGLAGHFSDTIRLCRLGLDQAAAAGAEGRADLELEMLCAMLLAAETVEESREIVRRRMPLEAQGVLWGVAAAWACLSDGGPAGEVNALIGPALAEVTPPRHADSLVATWAKFVLIANGEPDTARRLCDALVDLARPQGWLIALAHASFLRAIALLHLGRIHDARADAQLSFDFKRVNSPPAALAWSLFPLVAALTELGELEEAEDVLTVGIPPGEPMEVTLSGALVLEQRARLRLAERRFEEAHADLELVADWWRRLHVRHPAVAAWRVLDCEALVALGEPRRARARAEEHLALAERTGLPEPRAAARRAVARTLDADEAAVLLEEAVRMLEGTHATLEHTRALVDLGAALRRANRRSAARDPLVRALDRAERGGMRLLADRARHELHAAGARPRRTALSGLAALTPAEHEVAMLAASGCGNKEIAQRLFVTRRTVETHLTHVFDKLGIAGRTQLADLLGGGTDQSA